MSIVKGASTVVLLCLLPLIVDTRKADCLNPHVFRSAFSGFVVCVNDRIGHKYTSIREQTKSHTRKIVETCFTSGSKHHKKSPNIQCSMKVSELDQKAWDKNGPLKDCKLCRKFASAIVTATLYTPPEEAQCFQREITEAVMREGADCINRKHNDFPGLPPVPIVEKPSQEQIADLVDDISAIININSRVRKCFYNDTDAANSTLECIRKPFPGFMDAYNKVIQDCSSVIPDECQDELNTVKLAVCSCVDEARVEVRRRFEGLTRSVAHEAATKTLYNTKDGRVNRIEACIDRIKSYMKTDANDWFEVIEQATGKCLKSNPMRRSVGIKSLLYVGCKKILNDKSGVYMKMLSQAFDFVGFLIDAITSHSAKMCTV